MSVDALLHRHSAGCIDANAVIAPDVGNQAYGNPKVVKLLSARIKALITAPRKIGGKIGILQSGAQREAAVEVVAKRNTGTHREFMVHFMLYHLIGVAHFYHRLNIAELG